MWAGGREQDAPASGRVAAVPPMQDARCRQLIFQIAPPHHLAAIDLDLGVGAAGPAVNVAAGVRDGTRGCHRSGH